MQKNNNAKNTKIAESYITTQNLNVDCHDFATQNLAMTENDADSVNRRISHENAESKIKNTHPLTPSAREGGQNAESPPISSLQGARSEASATKQSIKKSNPCEAPKSRPLRGAKNREQGCSSATADFLLEADKRGSPPKSEKAAAFWRVGGAGRGVQPFLRKKTSESNLKNGDFIAESQNLKIDGCFASLTKQGKAEVSLFNPMDCHDSASQNLAMTENDADSVNRTSFCHIERSEISQKRDSSLVALAQNDEHTQPKLRPLIKGANGLSLGISIVVAILLGIGAGVLMQKIFGVFWVLFLGVAWGIAAAILNVYKVYKAELRDFEKIKENPKYRNEK
ncbi:AtpZ/AtpI family protein [Helicobacter sp. 23-1045]